jgi:TatD DNase family protein
MSPLVDSHSHFDAPEFDSDRADALARAREAGVTRQIVPAITRASWPSLSAMCAQYEGLFPAYGLHPMFLDEHRPEHLDELRDLVARQRPIAIGECGLDFYIETLDAETQRHYFHAQLELARDTELPVILHARRALGEVTHAVKRIGGLRGVVHSFSGSLEQARELWKLGFFLGIGGPVTYERARRLREIVAQMPIEFLLLETDSPDQPLATHRGVRNEPAWLVEVLDCIADLRGEPPEHVARMTRLNAERLFGLPSLAS